MRVTGEREKQLVYEYEPAAADLDSRIAEVAEVGSQYESGVRLTLSQLQAADARFSPSQPSSNHLAIEASWYDGGAEATVHICELIDDRVVSETDPTVVVDEFWDGRLHVTRSTIVMHRSDDGEWRRTVLLSVDGFEGLDTCPPES